MVLKPYRKSEEAERREGERIEGWSGVKERA